MNQKIEIVKVGDLKLHKKASELVPEMSVDEWRDFKESIKKDGVKVPIHVNMKGEVLDGRHRLLACRELGIDEIQVIYHDLTEDEEMRLVRDTAIERRNITKEQKLNIILQTENLIKSLYEEGRKKKIATLKKGSETPDLSNCTKRENAHNTREEIAKMSGVSSGTVHRAKKVFREEPELWKEVVDGKKSVYKAYRELDTIKEKQKNERVERGERDVKKETSPVKPKQFNQQPPKLSPEEIERQMFDANVTTFFRHLNELAGFVERTENFNEVVEEAFKRDKASIYDYAKALKKTMKLLKVEVL